MWRRAAVDGSAILALTLLLGWVLSLATTKVANWFVMTDELYYERLSISVAQTGSLLPRLYGDVVANVNQLYPVLLSFLYGDGDVPASFAAAHRLNAFVMVSAAVPLYVLARYAGAGRIWSLWAGGLAAAVPWIVLASFLLTEVVAYPAFCWALLALCWAAGRKSNAADAVALAAIGVAVLARVQFAVLFVVFAVAVIGEAALAAAADGRRGRELVRAAADSLLRKRRLLVAVYLAALVLIVSLALTTESSRLLGSYAVTLERVRVDFDLLRLAVQHLAVLALGFAIVPFVLGSAWLVDRLRPSALPRERAVAVVGVAALVLVTLQVASFNQRFGAGEVKDRYLFYALPVVVVAVAVAVARRRWPPWWALVVPAAVCSLGFVALPLRTYTKLNVDSPVAILNDTLLDLGTSETWGRALLVVAVIVAVQLLVLAATFVPRRVAAVAVAAFATIAVPAQAVYAFDRLFAVNGTNGLPITLDQSGVFNWIDRAVGDGGRVAMIRYPVESPDYWAGVAYWWDAEFWNESVVDRFADRPNPGAEPWLHEFDRRSGVVLRPEETQFLLVHGTDVRFRLAGRQVVFDRGAYVFDLDRPWRATWLTDGIYPDGWTRPHTPATITVFAEPGQRTPVRRFLFISVASPAKDVARPFTISSNLERLQDSIPVEVSIDRRVTVCVPPRGSAAVTVETPIVSAVYRDPTKAALTGEIDRPAGILLRSIALADETEPMESCPPPPPT